MILRLCFPRNHLFEKTLIQNAPFCEFTISIYQRLYENAKGPKRVTKASFWPEKGEHKRTLRPTTSMD